DAVAAAAEALASLGDAAGEAKAHFVHAVALARLGKIGACEAALDRALAAARRGRDRRRVNAVLAGAPLAALWGPSPVTRASGRGPARRRAPRAGPGRGGRGVEPRERGARRRRSSGSDRLARCAGGGAGPAW